MFKEIKTEIEQELFKSTFVETTEKYEFHYNEPTGFEKRYLLYKREQIIGTAEINPYFPTHYSIVQPYTDTDLSGHEKIKGFEKETYEIGKLCIKEEYQGLGYIKNLFTLIVEHHKQTNSKQYISQMVLPLYQMLTEGLGLPVHVLGEPDKDKVPGIPVLLDVEESLQNPKIRRILNKNSKTTV